ARLVCQAVVFAVGLPAKSALLPYTALFRSDRAAVDDGVGPVAALVDRGRAVGGGDADREAVGVGGVDVGVGDLAGGRHRGAVVALGNAAGLGGAGDHRVVVGAGDGDRDQLG